MSVDAGHRRDQGRTNGLANRKWTEESSQRLSGGGTDSACMDSDRLGVDGVWICGGAIRSLPAATPTSGAPSRYGLLWILALVWYGAHRVRRNRECICRLAPSSTGSRSRQGRYIAYSSCNAGCRRFICSGSGRTRDGDLFGFDSALGASQSSKR
jgi:MYXO-CTERM domain-containing protein